MTIRPLFDRILIKRTEALDRSPGGIYVAEMAKERPSEGEVLAVGNGRVADDGAIIALTVKAGDRVLFSKYAGTEVKEGDEERLILCEGDILGIIE